MGFGDADEIPSSRTIHLLKQCEMAGPSVDVGVWFAWGRLDRAFKPDWPVPGHPWTLGDPTFWTLQSATAYASGAEEAFPSRMRGKSGHFLLGGVHMTDNAYPPFLLAKIIACTECGEASKETLRKLGDCFSGEACKGLDNDQLIRNVMQILDRSVHFAGRISDVETAKRHLGEAYYLPWYTECYPDKFPGWFGKIDDRLFEEGGSPSLV